MRGRAVALLAVAVVAAVAAADRASRTRAASPTANVGALMSGAPAANTRGLIDETRGSFGAIRLGEAIRKVKSRLPARYYHGYIVVPGFSLVYCSGGGKRGCFTGVVLDVFDRCGLVNCKVGKLGGVGRIDFYASVDPAAYPPGQLAATLRGIHLGSPARAVRRAYTITQVGPGICGAPLPRPDATYVAVTPTTTILFTIRANVVWGITLRPGRLPGACSRTGP